jgi:hypothetical protein
MAIVIGGRTVQADDGRGYQPQGVNRPTQQQQNQYKAMADSMKDAGIRSLSGRTLATDDDERGFNVGEKAREIQKDFLAARDPVNYTPYEEQLFDFGRFSDVPSEGRLTETAGDPLKQKIVSNILKGKPPRDKVPLIDQFNNFMTSFGNVKFPTLPTPFGFGLEALKGFDSTNQFFKNLNTKKSGELSNKDKLTLINLVQRGGESGGLQYLKNWAEDNDLSEEETMDLANKFTGEYSNIGSLISDSGIIDYLTEGGKPEGFKDSVAAMFGQYDSGQIPGRVLDPESGDVRDYRIVDGKMENIMVDRPNLETVTDNLGTVGLEYLKATNPAAYYALRPAATSGQIEELAGMALTGNKNFDNQIFAAREQAARNKESQDRASGIPSLYAGPITPSDPNAIFNKPATKYPEGYGAFLLNPPAPVRPGSPTQPGFPDKDGDGVDDRYQAGPGIPRPGIESVGSLKPIKTNLPVTFDYASMAPQFTGSQYTNQGVSPAFLENLRRFYG